MYYLGTISLVFYLTLTVTEMTILKTIYIFKYSKIASMNEYFITNILVNVNKIFVLMNIFVRLILKEYESSPFLAYRNGHNQPTQLHKQAVR